MILIRSRFSRSVALAGIAALMLFLGACTAIPDTPSVKFLRIDATHPDLAYSGRRELTAPGRVSVSYSGARVRMRFEGDSLRLLVDDENSSNYAKAWIDGEPLEKFKLDAESDSYLLAEDLGSGEHTVEVVRLTECFLGLTHFEGFEIGGAAKVLPWQGKSDRKIEFIGDSITCGYGVEAEDPNLPFEAETENFTENYSGLTARSLSADHLVVARSGIGMVRNYDGPYEGSEGDMPDVYFRSLYEVPDYDWDFSRFVPDVVCINLGTNDFSTTGVNIETYVDDYTDFASRVLENYPEAQLVVILGPMNNSGILAAALQRVVANLKEVAPDRVNFLELSPQGELGFGASYHPNQAQSKVNAKELTTYLSELMDWR